MISRAAVFRGPGLPLTIEDIVIDPPGPTEILVRVAAVGLCHTELHVLRGERVVADGPMVLGHEAAGVVEAVGAEVSGIVPGDHVVTTFIPHCGRCRWCHRGDHHLCVEGRRITEGTQLDGTHRRRDGDGAAVGAFCMIGAFSERTVVDERSVVVIDRDTPLDQACLTACGVPAGVGAVRNRAHVRAGESVLVVGCGGTGMNAVQGARINGATTIIAADTGALQRDLAPTFGATHITGAREEELVETVLDVTGGAGVDHAFVCVSPAETLQPAFRATARGGNVVVTAMTPAAVPTIDIRPQELLLTQKALLGSLYGFTSPRRHIPELLALNRTGDLLLDELISRRYRLDEVDQGYRDVAAGRNVRGVVVLG